MQTALFATLARRPAWLRLRSALASMEVERVASKWEAAPPIQVVPTAADLPVPNAGPDVTGLFHRGRVYVVADQPQQRIGRVLMHEAVAHFGGRRLLGSSWRAFTIAVHKAARKGGDTFLRQLRRRVHDAYAAQKLRPALEGDEIVAAAAEELFDERSGRLLVHDPGLKMGEAVIGHLAREYLRADVPVNAAQLEGMLLLNEHVVRHGGLCWGAGWKAKRFMRWVVFCCCLFLIWAAWFL